MTAIQVSLPFLDYKQRVIGAAVLALMSWALGIESIDFLSWVGILGAAVANVMIVRPPFVFGSGGESVKWDSRRIIGILSSILCMLSLASGYLIVGCVPPSEHFVSSWLFFS